MYLSFAVSSATPIKTFKNRGAAPPNSRLPCSAKKPPPEPTLLLWNYEDLLLERQWHPRRRKKRYVGAIFGRRTARYPMPARDKSQARTDRTSLRWLYGLLLL